MNKVRQSRAWGSWTSAINAETAGCHEFDFGNGRLEPGTSARITPENQFSEMTEESVAMITDGKPAVTVDGERTELRPPDCLFVPAGASYSFENPRDGPVEFLWGALTNETSPLLDGAEVFDHGGTAQVVRPLRGIEPNVTIEPGNTLRHWTAVFPETVGSAYLNLGLSIRPPGSAVRMHEHEPPTLTEAFTVLRGTLLVRDPDGTEHVLEPGDFLYVPEHGMHSNKNVGTDDLVYACLENHRAVNGRQSDEITRRWVEPTRVSSKPIKNSSHEGAAIRNILTGRDESTLNMTEAVYLTSNDVAELADQPSMDDYIEAVRDGYRQRGEGAPAKPRTTLNPNEGPWGMLTSYMAILPDTGAMGGYMYDVGFGAEDGWLTTSLWDSDSGEFMGHLDGNAWNPHKTGATGAVGIDALAREEVTTLGLLGSGSQARGQLRAAVEVRDFEHVHVFSPTRDSREAFADEMDGKLAPEVRAVRSSAAAVSDADVVITATTSKEPVLDGSNLSPGTHVTAMGQYDPDGRELDDETIARATYVPDLRERTFHDAGSFLHSLEAGVVTDDHIHAELGEVVAGVKPGRTSDDEITVFDSGGTGVETVAAGKMLFDMGVEQDLGTTISIASSSEVQSD